jgi:hypothetical protein
MDKGDRGNCTHLAQQDNTREFSHASGVHLARVHMKRGVWCTYPCPSIMYEIIMIWSVSAFGNLSGSLVVSISHASTDGSGRSRRSGRSMSSGGSDPPARTTNHFATLSLLSIDTRMGYLEQQTQPR